MPLPLMRRRSPLPVQAAAGLSRSRSPASRAITAPSISRRRRAPACRARAHAVLVRPRSPAAVQLRSPFLRKRPTARGLEGPGWWISSFGATLAGVLLLGGASRRRRGDGRPARQMLALMAFALLITVAGCGGGSGAGGGHSQDPGTPAGSSTVTVISTTGTITHSATFALTVQ